MEETIQNHSSWTPKSRVVSFWSPFESDRKKTQEAPLLTKTDRTSPKCRLTRTKGPDWQENTGAFWIQSHQLGFFDYRWRKPTNLFLTVCAQVQGSKALWGAKDPVVTVTWTGRQVSLFIVWLLSERNKWAPSVEKGRKQTEVWTVSVPLQLTVHIKREG